MATGIQPAVMSRILSIVLCCWLAMDNGAGQQLDAAAVIRGIDAAVQARVDNVQGFTNIEDYAVFRGRDQTHPVAEMTVRDTYRRGQGKSYTVISESGSGIVIRLGLNPLLENEQVINEPSNAPGSWFDSSNYKMQPKLGRRESLNGRDCIEVAVAARRKAPNMIDGSIWVDAKSYSLAKIEGIASKSPSPFAGTTHLMREYTDIDGFSMAKHARAESNSIFFGRTVVTIDYRDYRLDVKRRD
jgi:hypothetical protein